MSTAVTRRRNATGLQVLRGVAIAIACTAILVAAFALVISIFNLSDGVIRAVNQGIKLLAILLGVRFAAPQGSENAILRGMLVGLIYMAAGVLVYALLTGQPLTAFAYLADLLLGIAAGGLMGMLRGKRQ